MTPVEAPAVHDGGVTEDYLSSRGHHAKASSLGPYIVVALNSQRPFDRPLRVPLNGAPRINLRRGANRVVRRDVADDGSQVCDVFIVDSSMSAKHAFIYLGDDGRYWLWDCGGPNGTTQNGAPVSGAVPLADGDWLGVGCSYVLFRTDAAVAGAFATRSEVEGQGPMTSLNPAVAESLGRALMLASSSSPVLIRGPVGSGRRTLAKAMHDRSGRSGQFVEVAAGEFPEALYSFRDAQDGTLYVRDVDMLDDEATALVLRGLANEEREGREGVVRLIGSSGVGAADHLRAVFGELVVSLPPLFHRREDLGQFVAELLERYEAPEGLRFRRSVCRALGAHPFRGNIAELAELVRQGVAYAKEDQKVVRLAHLPQAIQDTETAARERRGLAELFVRHSGNVREVASALGLSRQAVYDRAEKYGLEIKAFRKKAKKDQDGE